jgi:hypothetical protein
VTDLHSPQDYEIVERLRRLKTSRADYPVEPLKKRRASFMKKVNGFALFAPFASLSKGRFQFLSHLSAKGAEVVLVSLLAVGAGMGVYLSRDQIKDWLTPQTSTPAITLSTSRPTLTPTLTPTFAPTPTETLLPESPTSTKKPIPTDQGYHYGQTKTPKP